MRITLTYNQQQADSIEEGEKLTGDEVNLLVRTLESLGHTVTPVEASGPADDFVDRLIDSRPTLVFNLAEGDRGAAREARYPASLIRSAWPIRAEAPPCCRSISISD